ncbi:UDP-Glycosyltransferase/glycogen phosphorylase [Ophiobolus disseminans]|uniref:UDP-Glycosyltransferase/glycogen phosphorylase n=1 Tax=Ophiobolus disseminans TaxID=1469910 RepID=A0A6A7A8Q2_9PLEO|nr:UDP-Glycosyltransferase/glycogen phosphorylase [Ophiobolus disseminans]
MRPRPDSTQAPIPVYQESSIRRPRPDSTQAPIPMQQKYEHALHMDERYIDAPPPYEVEASGSIPQPGFSGATSDGRVDIDLDSRLTKTLIRLVPEETNELTPQLSRRLTVDASWIIPLNIVIQVVGSRGDVQPFVALGQELQKYGHRVRLATHDVFESFVLESGLEFYPIGGDAKELMAYMVKNPGLIPSMKSLREGDIQRKRSMITEILNGCWKSCIEPDIRSQRPFVCDAIIANPPSFAHIHCAQALGVPLHMMFTMPWSSTRAFPHPLANFVGSDVKRQALVNYASYGIVEFLTWQGLGDIINKFRNTLDLEDVPNSVGPVLAEALKIPHTYCWSPALVAKPPDWPSHIDVCGFFFRDPPKYDPPADIDRFLRDGPPPVYIGFGSIVIEDPVRMTSMILEAVRGLGVRAIISRGWSNLGEGLPAESKDVLFIDDCPHEWLFQWVAAVVHHGGAGTAACGLRNACPTVVVPFFGDQPFWGNMIATAGAGPKPMHHTLLTCENLTEAIAFCLMPDAREAAHTISSRIASERGIEAAVQSFHANLPLETMQCALLPNALATWTYKKTPIKMSKVAAQVLIDNDIILSADLTNHETEPITIVNNRWDPVTSTGSACFSIVGNMGTSTKSALVDPFIEMQRSDAEGATGAVTAKRMVTTSAKGFGKFVTSFYKGVIVDMPLATTEGFRNLPKLYGEEVKNHGEVTGVLSGFQVAGKNFAHGIVDGFSDPLLQTYKQGQKEGALGYAKGFGKGMAGFVSKTSSAVVGIVAYPGDGICKSIRHAAHRSTRRDLRARKLLEGEYLVTKSDIDVRSIIETFGRLRMEGKEKA